MQTFQEYEKKHLKRLRRLAPECMVLLKSNGDFPLSQPGEIALFGSGARRTIKGGTGSGDVNSRYVISVERGLEREGFSITTKDWLETYDAVRADAHRRFVDEIKRQAKRMHVLPSVLGMGAVMPEPDYEIPLEGRGDTAVYVLARICGEGADRTTKKGDFELTTTEVRDILALQKQYKRFLLVLNVGGVVDLSPVQDVSNILLLSQLGAVTGLALADVLLGRSYPSGKLTATWAKMEDYPHVGTFGSKDDTDYREGIYVGYRYLDTVGKTPLFPFGYGLSYTLFELGKTSVDVEKTMVSVKTKVKNKGESKGKEVVQLYVSVPDGKLDQPFQSLAAFKKTKELAPKDSEEVELCFDLRDLASYDREREAFVLEKGNYILRIGTSSRDTKPVAVLSLAREQIVKKVSAVAGEIDFQDYKPEKQSTKEKLSDLPSVKISSGQVEELQKAGYPELSEETKTFVKELSDEELVSLCIGHFENNVLSGVIGDSATQVAGAAGETTCNVEDVPVLILADGPAGLRLSKDYVRDEKGAHTAGDSLLPGMTDFLGPVEKAILKKAGSAKGTILHQYCTAIPIGTALAQSCSDEVLETCGNIVGEEMELFGVHLWLAPGMNIQRNPLCGRNFEYYSEDPLVSGLSAAAITRGVQRHPGRGTTIKHFCCNNQETNRAQNSSSMSERTLREIYLKGFEIAIRESNPAALMTSYNLLNGVHTSARADLLKTVLREEWGYEGLVMSDWVIPVMKDRKAFYKVATAAPAIYAGNDLFMPGNASDFRNVMAALHGGNPSCKLSREDLELCAGRIVQLAWRLVKAINE